MYSRINSLLDNQFQKYNRKKMDFNLIIDSDLCIQCYVYEFDMILHYGLKKLSTLSLSLSWNIQNISI